MRKTRSFFYHADTDAGKSIDQWCNERIAEGEGALTRAICNLILEAVGKPPMADGKLEQRLAYVEAELLMLKRNGNGKAYQSYCEPPVPEIPSEVKTESESKPAGGGLGKWFDDED